MSSAINAEQTSMQSQSDVPNAIMSTVNSVPVQKQESAINVLKLELEDLQIKTKLLEELDHPMVKMAEAMAMDRIQQLTMEAINRFLSSSNPGEIQKKVKSNKLQTGHGTISIVKPTP